MKSNLLTRPKMWTEDKNIYVNNITYNMNIIHKFLMKCVDKYEITYKKNLLKDKGLLGYGIFDEYSILLDYSLKKTIKERYITIFHEFFHVFFHDDNDKRDRTTENCNDPIEKRAEISARNMYDWYVNNPIYFNHLIKKLIEKRRTKIRSN